MNNAGSATMTLGADIAGARCDKRGAVHRSLSAASVAEYGADLEAP